MTARSSIASATRRMPWARLAACVVGAAAVLTQVVFPLTNGGTVSLTILSVILMATASLIHVAATRGAASLVALVAVAGGGGLVAETIGVHTGVPFGSYSYNGTLGPQLLGVPAIVPLAWLMMAYPSLLVARRLVGSRPVVVPVIAAWALTTWDVFLDPQMVDAGHWRWDNPAPSLPGVDGIPLSNFAGWLVVGVAMCALLDRLIGSSPSADDNADLLPFALFLWTYASSVLAHSVFFGRASVALIGGLLMGTVAIPLAVTLWRDRARRERE